MIESEDIQLDDYTCFQFTNTIIVPHWGSKYFKGMYLEERLKLAYQADEPPFLLLSDYQYVVITGMGTGLHITNTKG